MNGSSIDVVQTVPAQITMHTIENHQLDKLVNISRPISLSFSGVSIGVFFSFFPSCLDSLDKIGTGDFGPKQLAYFGILIAALIIGLVTTFFALKGEADARTMVTEIRGREVRKLSS